MPFPDSKIFNSGTSPHKDAIFSEIIHGAISIPSRTTHSPFSIDKVKTDS
jgi:hypothetical protein